MPRKPKIWMAAPARRPTPKPSPIEKAAITKACEALITETIIPRHLPEIRPTEFNYPVAVYGKWLGNKYRFITKFRTDRPDSISPEFGSTYARMDYDGPDRFSVWWHRHTGEWRCVFEDQTLDDAIELLATEPFLRPPI